MEKPVKVLQALWQCSLVQSSLGENGVHGKVSISAVIKKKKSVLALLLLMVTCVALFPQLSLLEDAGFGGVLLYTDPCDLPKTADLADKAFMVSLNSGGDPSTPGYASIGKYWSGFSHNVHFNSLYIGVWDLKH